MADRTNFIIGYGERLASELAAPAAGGPKAHPYTFAEARKRLVPKMKAAVKELAELPKELCPKDQTVALVTLHPTYLAKTYYPAELLRTYALETIGSRPREISPTKWARKKPPASAVTSELFVAGTRAHFRQLAADVEGIRGTAAAASDLIKIEDFRTQPPEEKLKPFRSEDEEPLLEVVLHAWPVAEDAFILEGFEAYLKTLDLKLDLDKRRFFAEGLCFMPLRVPREIAPEVVKYSFLRLAREMPRLRQFRPLTRATPGFSPFACRLPKTDPIDRDIRVAVFDGGVKADAKLDPWVARKKTKNLGSAVQEFQNHGTAVTSALLFGPLQDSVTADRPYAGIDHYRVLDADTLKDDQQELYSVLERIRDILESRPKYDFVNLSLGPDLPVEDSDVHAWTAVLDQLFSDGMTLPTIAVGNGGEADWDSGNARIQTPADCVNALSVGGCDRLGAGWKRASYSSIGPGRSPGIMKPDGLAFGGSSREKELAIRRRFSTRLEDALRGLDRQIAAGRLTDRAVLERKLGRLQERYPMVADLYAMTAGEVDGRLHLDWHLLETQRAWRDAREGAYLLRTNLEGQTAEELWTKYIQLTEAEAAFRALKSELAIRPVFHQLEHRAKAHILVAFLGYALWVTLKHQLRRSGTGLSPAQALAHLATLQSADIVLPTTDGREIRLRRVAKPTPAQQRLLDQMGITIPAHLEWNAECSGDFGAA